MTAIVQEGFRYATVSACALIIDITVLFILVHCLSWWYVAATTMSFLVGLFVANALSVARVFQYRRLQDPRIEFASFAGIKILGVHYLIANCRAAGFTFVWNFLARCHFLFLQRRTA
jgi:putative flippase GtrA